MNPCKVATDLFLDDEIPFPNKGEVSNQIWKLQSSELLTPKEKLKRLLIALGSLGGREQGCVGGWGQLTMYTQLAFGARKLAKETVKLYVKLPNQFGPFEP